jgi:hypothetical protein
VEVDLKAIQILSLPINILLEDSLQVHSYLRHNILHVVSRLALRVRKASTPHGVNHLDLICLKDNTRSTLQLRGNRPLSRLAEELLHFLKVADGRPHNGAQIKDNTFHPKGVGWAHHKDEVNLTQDPKGEDNKAHRDEDNTYKVHREEVNYNRDLRDEVSHRKDVARIIFVVKDTRLWRLERALKMRCRLLVCKDMVYGSLTWHGIGRGGIDLAWLVSSSGNLVISYVNERCFAT